MAFQAALGLGAARALCLECRTGACPQRRVRFGGDVGVNARVAIPRNVSAIRRNGGLHGLFSRNYQAGGRRGFDGQLIGSGRTVVMAQGGSDSESGFRPQEEKRSSTVDPETGIDAEGYVTASLPEEFLELMKDEGEPPNFGLLALGVVVAFVARGIIWREIQNWINLAFLLVVVAAESVQAVAYKVLELGGQPVEAVVNVFWVFAQTVIHFFRLAGETISVRPVAFAILLSTVVLLVGESVSKTYQDAPEFPSRNTLDFAGFLGLAAVVGVISGEFMLLALLGFTLYLLGVKKYNPVAGLTPAVATMVAIAGPSIRWPVFAAFVGSSVFRYWRKGYLSQGAVLNTKVGKYPRVLVGLVYLVVISMVSKFVFAFEAFFPTSPPPLDE